MDIKNTGEPTRRKFITTGGAIAATTAFAGFSILSSARGQNNAPLKVGLIGCGGRGKGAAEQCLKAGANIHLVALADLYKDKLDGCLKYLKDTSNRKEPPPPNVDVKEDHCFVGFDAYQKLIDSGVDIVLLATPPGFRPIHFEAAINAGKHVFTEKPVAVDPVGIKKILAAGEKAKAKNLSVVAGTQRRHDPSYIETIKRIHGGEIGDVVAARCYWNGGTLWKYKKESGWDDMMWQTRNWYYFDWLSGDHIVEQHVHNLDVVNWIMKAYPAKALGIGGRQVRVDPLYGNIYDHFTIDYEYPNGVHMMSMCRQQDGTDTNVSEFIVGSKGTSDPKDRISGLKRWKYQGAKVDPYQQEHVDFINAIRSGKPINEAENVAYSTLTAIMGRESAYTGKIVTWDEMLKSTLDIVPKKFEFGPLPYHAVPTPGKPRPV